MKARQILKKIVKNPKKLFLIDSIGAGLTLFFLLAILLPFNEQVGLPPSVLLALAVPVLLFALYSACCFLFAGTHWRSLLKAIAVANLLYCCMTAGLIMANYAQLTLLGITYFVLEIAVVCALVSVELRALTPSPVNTKR